MSRAEPLKLEELPTEDARLIEDSLDLMGFVANDALTMARVPGLLAACAALVKACYKPGRLEFTLKRRVAYLVSRVSGCRYCEAHTAHGAGLSPAEIETLWSFEHSDSFSDKEKAAFMMARDAGTSNTLSSATAAELRQHFDDTEICELTAVLSLFAFLNRWNSLLATELESAPLQFANENLTDTGWQPGLHAGANKR